MKKAIACAFLSVVMILNLGIPAYGGGVMGRYELSPALELISEKLTLEKCISKSSTLKLSAEEFENVLGRDVRFVSVSELPEPSMGVIKYAGREVTSPITVSRGNASLLTFVPGDSLGVASFSVCVDGEKDTPVVCNVNILEKENSAPTAKNVSLEVYSGIPTCASFNASDKDGDKLCFDVTEYPDKGELTISGNSFVYTAAENKKGKDSFVCSVSDEYGNSAGTFTVSLKIKQPKSDIRYTDMQNHWGYGAAMQMTEMGLMTGTNSEGGISFMPDGEISRGDFLAMAMICAGLEEEVSLGAVSAFADDSHIPSNIRSYAAHALECGMVSGYKGSDGRNVFKSTEGITRAEAVTMLCNILELSPTSFQPEFTDSEDIPSFARQGFAALCEMGIINGSPDGALNPCNTLTRAEAAQILSRI